jgi:hypothetical protein
MTVFQQRLDRAVAQISALPAQSSFWMWMTDRGPDGQPFIMLLDQERDPTGAQFAKRAKAVLASAPLCRRAVAGVLRRLGSGQLSFSTTDSIDRVRRIHATLCRTGAAIGDLLVVQVGGQLIQQTVLCEDHTRSAALLADEGVRWMTLAWSDRMPTRLTIAEDRESLTQTAEALKARGYTVCLGQLKIKGGRAAILVRRNPDAAQTALSAWVASNRRHWSVAPLSTARITARS